LPSSVRLALLALFISACAGSQPPPGRISSTGDVPGDIVDLTAFDGQVIYLDFWASWCGPCRQSFPFMDDLYRRYHDQGLTVIAVNVDKDRDKATAFLEGMSTPFTIVYDSEGVLPKAFALPAMPTSFVFDRRGKLRASHVGFEPSSIADIEEEIVRLLSED
jgi:thiol-disulfide isomerase/thioredoxin